MSEPAAVLAQARALLARTDEDTAGLWPRAAALLARQGLEEALDAYWHQHRVDLSYLPARQQLICLREYLSDSALAGQVHDAWARLSRACHQHPYELAPTAAELRDSMDVADRFVVATASSGRPPRGERS